MSWVEMQACFPRAAWQGLALAEALLGIQGVLENLLIREQKNPYLIVEIPVYFSWFALSWCRLPIVQICI